MALFDCVAPLRGGTWLALTARRREDHGAHQWAERQRAALKAARLDPEVSRALEGDRALYETANAQLDRHLAIARREQQQYGALPHQKTNFWELNSGSDELETPKWESRGARSGGLCVPQGRKPGAVATVHRPAFPKVSDYGEEATKRAVGIEN